MNFRFLIFEFRFSIEDSGAGGSAKEEQQEKQLLFVCMGYKQVTPTEFGVERGGRCWIFEF
jgi:hypothetical protein